MIAGTYRCYHCGRSVAVVGSPDRLPPDRCPGPDPWTGYITREP
jgi:hypothetical protein